MKSCARRLLTSCALIAVAVSAAPGTAIAGAAPKPQVAHAAVKSFPAIERDWIPANDGRQPPGPGAMAYDEKRQQTVLLVPGDPSQTWVFDAGSRRWSRKLHADGPNLANAAAAYDRETKSIVLFGSNADEARCEWWVPGETWTWDGATWTPLHPRVAPSECVGLGALQMASYTYYADVLVATLPDGTSTETWKWNGRTWKLANRNAPVGAAVIEWSARAFAFGGAFSPGAPGAPRALDDFGATRVWRGSAWSTIAPGGGRGDPPPRTSASLAEADFEGPVLFGGVSRASPPRVLADTWHWEHGRWARMATRHSPPPMADAAFVYDAAHGVSVLFGSGGTWLLGPARAGGGYLMCASDGGVFTFGDARFYGSTGAMHLNQPIVGIARTPSRKGYWLVASDGGVFTFGDARFYGSTGNVHLNRPIIGIAPTATGRGYWLVASDGGIFAFGDAPFLGSTAGRHLTEPIVGIATVQEGNGYYLVARDGNVFTFGDARLYRPPRATIALPVVGIARNPITSGYWIANRAGAVFAYATDHHGYASGPHAPIVAVAASPTTHGYWLFGSDGTVHAFGDAHAYGNAPANIKAPIVGATVT
jgi:hypothetical protein